MSASTRLLAVILPLLALVAGFWLLVLGPKREEASDLERQRDDLSSQLSEQAELAESADAARREFPTTYRRLLVLGKAVPQDDDTSSFLVQLDRIAASTDVKFTSLQTQTTEGGTAAPAPVPQTPAETADAQEQRVEDAATDATATATPAPASEAQAASLPIGATIGPAGLPVMRYALTFSGDFFALADFFAGLDRFVRARADGTVGTRGRLITVDKFDLAPVGTTTAGTPELTAELTVTTYLTPVDEGLTAGATPAGPSLLSSPAPASTAGSESPPSQAATASVEPAP